MASTALVANNNIDGGWDEAAAETSGRAIQGSLIRFNDWK